MTFPKALRRPACPHPPPRLAREAMAPNPAYPDGILPRESLLSLIDSGAVTGAQEARVQPASLDLTLGDRAVRVRASFLPGEGASIASTLDSLALHEIPLDGGAVLETGCVYLIPLREGLSLPPTLEGLANPKSSTGRLDVFTRVICDGAVRFDAVAPGYRGPLWVEVAPRTFPILARTGDALVQLRLRAGPAAATHTQTVSIDLSGSLHDDGRVGYRARRHSGLVDLSGVGAHAARDYWDPLYAPGGELVLDPDEFYILASAEAVSIPHDQAAEMAPIAPEIGEFRAHYAGFFDPGFGLGQQARAVLEVRGRDVPFLLRHGQPVARLVFEPMSAPPATAYGQGGNYQGQGLKLGKHFRD